MDLPLLETVLFFLLSSTQLVHGWRVYDYIAYQKYRFSVRQNRWMMRNETLDESIAEPMQTLDLMCFSSQVRSILVLLFLLSSIVRRANRLVEVVSGERPGELLHSVQTSAMGHVSFLVPHSLGVPRDILHGCFRESCESWISPMEI